MNEIHFSSLIYDMVLIPHELALAKVKLDAGLRGSLWRNDGKGKELEEFVEE